MLNVLLTKAQRACCTAMDEMAPTLADTDHFVQRMIEMFARNGF